MFSLLRPLGPGAAGSMKTSLAAQSRFSARLISLKPNFSKLKLIEQPPGYIVDTVNEAYKPPPPNLHEGSHHWAYERIVSAMLVPLLATPFIAGVHHPVIDATFCVSLLIHCHAGIKSCIIDYIPKRVYGVWHGIATKLLTLGSFVSLYGIYLLETTGNGIFDFIASIWNA